MLTDDDRQQALHGAKSGAGRHRAGATSNALCSREVGQSAPGHKVHLGLGTRRGLKGGCSNVWTPPAGRRVCTQTRRIGLHITHAVQGFGEGVGSHGGGARAGRGPGQRRQRAPARGDAARRAACRHARAPRGRVAQPARARARCHHRLLRFVQGGVLKHSAVSCRQACIERKPQAAQSA